MLSRLAGGPELRNLANPDGPGSPLGTELRSSPIGMSAGEKFCFGLPLDPFGVDTFDINDLDDSPLAFFFCFFFFPSDPSAIAPSVF